MTVNSGSSLYFTTHEYEKEVTIRDRAMASQRNLHTKGGAPRAERRGACINTHSGNCKCHASLRKHK